MKHTVRRILIINAVSVNTPSATGITLRSILSTLEPDHLLGLYWGQIPQEKPLPIREIRLPYSPLSAGYYTENMRRSRVNGTIKAQSAADASPASAAKPRITTYIRQRLALFATDPPGIRLTKAVLAEIDAFSPEVIYTLGGCINTLKLSYRLSLRYNIPIVTHYMDNWLYCLQWENNPLLTSYKHKLRKFAAKCRLRSDRDIAISPKMAAVYTDKLGKEHAFIMNSIDTAAYCCHDKPLGSPIRFVYAGGLHLGRDRSLQIIASVIESAAADSDKDIELCIYTPENMIPQYRKQFEAYPRTHFFKAVPHDRIMSVYEEADVLVHIESGELVNNGFFRYSISTKIPEYLSTGKPILFFGPKDIYLFEFLSEQHLACTAADEAAVRRAVNDLLTGSDTGKTYAANAAAFARANFDRVIGNERFLSVIDSVSLPKPEK